MAMISPVFAAQYLRMSTEHQQYSLTNQAAAIQRYAEVHGFLIVKTYFDHGRSGLQMKYRYGLQQLLRDVVSEEPGFLAIAVFLNSSLKRSRARVARGEGELGSSIWWQEWRDSNPRPSVLETDALPAELHS